MLVIVWQSINQGGKLPKWNCFQHEFTVLCVIEETAAFSARNQFGQATEIANY